MSERELGISNHFKAQFKLDQTNLLDRLMRKHRVMKRSWYNNVNVEDNIEYKIEKLAETLALFKKKD